MPTVTLANAPAAMQKALRKLTEKQLRYATPRAIKYTAGEVQLGGKALIATHFVNRRKTAQNLVRVQTGDGTSKDRYKARVGFFGDRADVFAKFEDGGFKGPKKGRSVAMPARDNRRAAGGGPRESLSKFLPLANASRVKGRQSIVAGQAGAFLVRSRKRPEVSVLIQRRKRAGARALFVFVDKTRVLAQLDFMPTAQKIARATFPRAFRAAFVEALRTAKV